MSETTHLETRRQMLVLLYEVYIEDPLKVMSPEEILEVCTFDKKQLASNSHYMHDRGFIELLIGYNPPLFAAARISPEGIDLIEDAERFHGMFLTGPVERDAIALEAPPMVLHIVDEVEALDISAARKQWLLDDLQKLRDELRKPREIRSNDRIRDRLQALDEYFDRGAQASLPRLSRLAAFLTEQGLRL